MSSVIGVIVLTIPTFAAIAYLLNPILGIDWRSDDDPMGYFFEGYASEHRH